MYFFPLGLLRVVIKICDDLQHSIYLQNNTIRGLNIFTRQNPNIRHISKASTVFGMCLTSDAIQIIDLNWMDLLVANLIRNK